MDQLLHCHRCGDVIGVYEPLIVLVEGGPRLSSRAQRPDIGSHGACYHRACFERAGELPDDRQQSTG